MKDTVYWQELQMRKTLAVNHESVDCIKANNKVIRKATNSF
jgi:hypothetical protein